MAAACSIMDNALCGHHVPCTITPVNERTDYTRNLLDTKDEESDRRREGEGPSPVPSNNRAAEERFVR